MHFRVGAVFLGLFLAVSCSAPSPGVEQKFLRDLAGRVDQALVSPRSFTVEIRKWWTTDHDIGTIQYLAEVDLAPGMIKAVVYDRASPKAKEPVAEILVNGKERRESRQSGADHCLLGFFEKPWTGPPDVASPPSFVKRITRGQVVGEVVLDGVPCIGVIYETEKTPTYRRTDTYYVDKKTWQVRQWATVELSSDPGFPETIMTTWVFQDRKLETKETRGLQTSASFPQP